MEVVGAYFQVVKGQRLDAFCLHVNDSVLVLQRTFYQNKFAPCDHDTLPFIKIRSDDDIGNAGFIFHGEKDEALSCAGALSCNDTTGCAHIFSVLVIAQLRGGQYLHRMQLFTTIVQWMLSHCKAGTGIVRTEPLLRRHLPKRGRDLMSTMLF